MVPFFMPRFSPSIGKGVIIISNNSHIASLIAPTRKPFTLLNTLARVLQIGGP